ncbi:MAG: ThuA domain-containing protein, partial [Spirosomaceae bacterium]|nr:ThuA domain-containing protein [Spirosomataceae bacterium]
MKKLTMAMLLAVVTIGAFAQKKKAATKEKDAILVFAKTKGFRHQSIPKGKQTLMMLGTQNNFRVDTTEDAAAFTLENLKKYKAV